MICHNACAIEWIQMNNVRDRIGQWLRLWIKTESFDRFTVVAEDESMDFYILAARQNDARGRLAVVRWYHYDYE